MGYAQYKELDSSGVSWLQKKPSHWRIKRLKFSTDLINKKVALLNFKWVAQHEG
jgi:hypothetical protein